MNGNQIWEIKPEGIVYVDDEGNECFIDLAVCHENYVKYQTSKDYWEKIKEINHLTDADFERHVERRKKWKEVGVRQSLGQPWDDGPYLEFHTNPPIRFQFETKEEFNAVVHAIHLFGWHTFDLS